MSGSRTSSSAWRAYSIAGMGAMSSSPAMSVVREIGRVGLHEVDVEQHVVLDQPVVQRQAVEELDVSEPWSSQRRVLLDSGRTNVADIVASPALGARTRGPDSLAKPHAAFCITVTKVTDREYRTA